MKRTPLVGMLVALCFTPKVAHASHCHEESESRAVGYATCHSFGSSWDEPRITPALDLSLGSNIHVLDLRERTFSFCGVGKCPSLTLGGMQSISGSGFVGSSTAATLAIRITALRIGPLRLGPQAEIGGGSTPRSYVSPTATGSGDALWFGEASIFAGAHVALGHVVVAAEIAPTLRTTTVAFDHLTVNGQTTPFVTATDSQFECLGEASALFYADPHLGFGVRAGADLAHPDDVYAGVFFRLSMVAFEGAR